MFCGTLILGCIFCGLLLADEETEDDEEDAEPFHPRELLAEEKEHPNSRESGADVVESVSAGNTDDTDGIAETDKSNDGRPECQITDCRQGTPQLVGSHLGKVRKTAHAVGKSTQRIEQDERGQLDIENDRQGIVFGRDTAENNGIEYRSRDRRKGKGDTPRVADTEIGRPHQHKQKHADGRDNNPHDIVPRNALMQDDGSKERRQDRTGGEQRLGDSGRRESVVTERLQNIVQERLKNTAQDKERQVPLIHPLQAEHLALAGAESDQEHQQHRQRKTNDNHCHRGHCDKGFLDSNTRCRPDKHGQEDG